MIITGHRGAANLVAENTLLSMQMAIDLGVDQIETDVHLTKDQQLVIIHDQTVDRTTNGTGRVAESTLTQIKQLDAGEGQSVPTLLEVIDLVRTQSPTIILQIELKGPDTAEPVVQMVEDQAFNQRVILTSFVHSRLVETHRLNPNLRFGALWTEPPADACLQATEMGAEAIHINHQHLTAELVQQAHQAGLKIRAWNPDTVEEMQQMIDLGVDAIGSNRPDLLIQLCRGA